MLQRAREALTSSNVIGEVAAVAAPRRAEGQVRPADPEAIRRRYFTQDKGAERRYFDDYQGKSPAFRAGADRLASKREDLNTIRAMLDVAEARGWREVALKGTVAFRRDAWIEAAARGLPARGHHASDLDQQEAERRRGLRQPTQTASAPPAMPASATPSQSRSTAEAGLSADGQLVLRVIGTRIEASMRKLTKEAKTELKAFAVAELARKEGRDGPVALTPRQRGAATAVRLVEPRQPVSASAAVAATQLPPEQRLARRR
jgi:hypothetical protein